MARGSGASVVVRRGPRRPWCREGRLHAPLLRKLDHRAAWRAARRCLRRRQVGHVRILAHGGDTKEPSIELVGWREHGGDGRAVRASPAGADGATSAAPPLPSSAKRGVARYIASTATAHASPTPSLSLLSPPPMSPPSLPNAPSPAGARSSTTCNSSSAVAVATLALPPQSPRLHQRTTNRPRHPRRRQAPTHAGA